jgi:beta-galactosidase
VHGHLERHSLVTTDPYLQQKINDLKDTPAQRKFRTLCPLPVGVVVWQRVNDDLDALRREFRTIHEHDITALKQLVLAGDIPVDQAEADVAALEEGLIPWHYGIAGWAPISSQLLETLGIRPDLSMAEIQRHPKMLGYQTEFLKERARLSNAVCSAIWLLG